MTEMSAPPDSLPGEIAEETETATQSTQPARVGRPPKALIDSKLPGARKSVGRPKGDAAIMNEYKARMLASPKSARVLEKILDAALDDHHKNQAAAWKIVADRILPLGVFEEGKKNRPRGISITITTASPHDGVTVENDEDIEDGEYTDC